jgi:Spy/CpxP family protein refolding chaperone
MKKSFVISVLLLVLSVSLIAQPGEKMKRMQMGMGDKPILAKLNLTPEQEKQFNDITYDHQKKVIDLKSQVEKNRLELRKMINEKNIDEKKLLDLTDANNKLQAEMKASGVKRWIAINKMLNDDQKEIWSKHLGIMGNREGMRGMMKQRMKERVQLKMR